MTRNHVHIQLANAVLTAFETGMRTAREAGPLPLPTAKIKEVMGAEIASAAAFVMPAVEALQEEAVEMAVRHACAPYSDALTASGDIMKAQTPAPGSPLFSVWLHGVLCASDAVAKQLGGAVDLDGAADAVLDGSDLVEAIAASLAKQSRERVIQ